MTAPGPDTVVLGATRAAPPDGVPARAGRTAPGGEESLTDVVVQVLARALGGLPAPLRRGTPVLLAATDHCVATTSGYVARCVEAEAGGRRLRPSESMAPEPAQLLQEFAERSDWDGAGHVLISPRGAAEQALRWARGAVAAGLHEAMVVCELARDPESGGCLVTATLVAAPAGAPSPGDAAGSGVVLSGLGLVTAFGDGVDLFWRELLAGRRALSELTRFDAARFRSRTVCQAAAEAGPGLPVRRILLDRARTEALAGAGLTRLPERTLLVGAGVVPHLPTVDGAPQIREISLEEEWDGEGFGVSPGNAALLAHACASGAFGLAMAREWLLSGLADMAVVTGVSALNVYDYACLDVLRATSTRTARPFDRERSGVTIGEGAGAVVLETAEHAAARGHRPAATLSGIACRVGGRGTSALSAEIAADCMRAALDMAGTDRVDHVHGHAPGTRQGDEAELLALDTVGAERGWRGVPVSSYKGAAGHLLHASVFPALAAAVQALRRGVVPGTPGLRSAPDTRHVRVPAGPEPCDGIRSVLVDNFGFGGNNAALLLTSSATNPPKGEEPAWQTRSC
ncbi:beta-ketoacyl synthase N-terminal-like domain-containing protein [Streptomyces sp. bgisy100]|uniref:beta-ketoacyl synthase N-terminal-like domain-containing protein n=1 Tax=Streptomyces sp. bgisy100 TaxID=3413783 RepID=UPI003D74E048